MADFYRAIPFILQHEGGLSSNQADRGGTTKFGISAASYPDLDIPNLSLEDAVRIYREDFWDALSLDDVNDQALASKVLDVAVHFGTKGGTRLVQRAVNSLNTRRPPLKVDGAFGPLTLAAVNAANPDTLIAKIQVHQLHRYANIAAASPSQVRFLRGWADRALFPGE